MKNLLARSGVIALLSLVLPTMASADMAVVDSGATESGRVLVRHMSGMPGMAAWQGGLWGNSLAYWITMVFIWVLLASASAALWHWMLHHGSDKKKRK